MDQLRGAGSESLAKEEEPGDSGQPISTAQVKIQEKKEFGRLSSEGKQDRPRHRKRVKIVQGKSGPGLT